MDNEIFKSVHVIHNNMPSNLRSCMYNVAMATKMSAKLKLAAKLRSKESIKVAFTILVSMSSKKLHHVSACWLDYIISRPAPEPIGGKF